MKSILGYINSIFLCTIVILFSIASNACPDKATVGQYIQSLQKYKNSEWAWTDYSLVQGDHIVADLEQDPHCFLLISNGKVQVEVKTDDQVISLLATDAQIEGLIPPGISPDQHEKVKASILNSILNPEWTVIPHFPQQDLLRKWSNEITDKYKNLLMISFTHFKNNHEIIGLAHHEGFHIYKQGGPNWPTWDVPINSRESMSKSCYFFSETVTQAYRNERALILEAAEKSVVGNKDGAKIALTEFIKARNQRYYLLTNANVNVIQNGRPYGCPELENSLELQEGTARFIEVTANVATDVWSLSEMIVHLRNEPDFEPAYMLGASQLLAIKEFKTMKEVTLKLEQSKSHLDGIFGLLQAPVFPL